MGIDLERQLPSVGICVKSQDGTVLSQNEKCLSQCGHQIGNRCEKGCMVHNHMKSSSNPQGAAIEHLKNIKLESGPVDAVMLNDGNHLVTLLFDKSKRVEDQLKLLLPYRLTVSEVLVLKKYLMGQNHREIAEQLFISRSTLKTHLNNIFKKVPDEVREALLATHQA